VLFRSIKIDRKDGVIKKYLSTLSTSRQMLDSGDMSLSGGAETKAKAAPKDGAAK
jgi:hypothetical protein